MASIRANRSVRITDVALMPNALRFAVATTNRDLCFFDLSNGKLCNRIVGLPDVATAVDYCCDERDHDFGALVFGDLGG